MPLDAKLDLSSAPTTDETDSGGAGGITLSDKPAVPKTATTIVRIAPDGGVIIESGAPAVRPDAGDYGDFNENLAERLSDGSKATIVEEILQGIDADERGRQQFIENYTKGIDLLGLKIEEQTNTKTQKRNVSRVRHPLLLEACVRGQSSARAELLPAGGPCKVLTVGGSEPNEDDLARAFESDMNYYLTTVAKEYYPDFDRGLFELYFGGNLFKKVYTCPVRRRPVSDTINVSDLIVSEDARNHQTATRVTHRSMMIPSMVKRMQWTGAWLDVELSVAMPNMDPAKRKEREVMGIGQGIGRPEDQERCIYETEYDIDLERFGIREKGGPRGLPIPYMVTIDKDSRRMLALRRNWKKGDKLFMRRQRYVHYCLVPGFGFLGMGYLHLLGNQTRALTAMWRILCDSGMFACFPGGVKAKGMRMSTNEIQPGPGEWVDIDIGPFDRIQDAMMPMPYKDPSAVFIQFAEIVGQDAQRMAGSIEMEVGEGRTNIPVGTIMSMIEQQTQVMAAVHKRLHTAQAQELLLLRAEFADNPDNLKWLNRDLSAHAWDKAAEFMNLNLVPASDPNIPAQTHRIMQATSMVTLATSNPDIYDRLQVHKHALRTLGIINSDPYLHAPTPTPPDPAKAGGKAPDPLGPQKLQLEAQEAQRKAAQETVESNRRQQELQLRSQNDQLELASRERISSMQEDTQRLRLQTEQERMHTQEARADAEAKHKMGLQTREHVRADIMAGHKITTDRKKTATDGLAAEHEMGLGQVEQQRENRLAQHQISQDSQQNGLDAVKTQHEIGVAAAKHGLDVAQTHHEMTLGHRDAERDDRLATHEIKTTPKPIATAGGRTRRTRSPSGAKK